MRSTLFLGALVLAIAACGGDKQAAPMTRGLGKAEGGAAKPAAAAPGPARPAPALLGGARKIADEMRRDLTKADWQPDPTGDYNRDPFRPYTLGSAKASSSSTSFVVDACEGRRHIAPNVGMGDVKLVGILMRGTRSYALFVDGAGNGFNLRLNDCLSKDKVKIARMSEDRVIGEYQPSAPPGMAAPPPQLREWKLHQAQLELTDLPPEEGGQATAPPAAPAQ